MSKARAKQEEPDKIAIIDIGSNSVRMVVFQTSPASGNEGYRIQPVKNTKKICELGKLTPKGKIAKKNSDKALKALKDFARYLEKNQIREVIPVATAAARHAKNGEAFIQKAQKSLGRKIDVLDAEQEAGMAALGVIQAHQQEESPLDKIDGIVADLGGGSLELARIKGPEIEKGISLKLGTLIMDSAQNSQEVIDQQLGTLDSPFRNTPGLYVIGGSWRAIRKTWELEEGLEDSGKDAQNSEETHLKSVPSSALKKHLEYILDLQTDPDDLNEKQRTNIPYKLRPESADIHNRYPDLSANRANKIFNAARLLVTLIEKSGAQNTIFVESGLREGLVYKHLARSGLSRMADSHFIRLSEDSPSHHKENVTDNDNDAGALHDRKTHQGLRTGNPDPFK